MTDQDRHVAAFDQVLELAVLMNDDMTRSLARDGLTVSRAHLLWVLGERGPTTQRALADALDVSARNITGLVDGLVATGFVTRQPHPTDRRATLISFTEHGEAITKVMQEGQQELASDLFADMPPRQLACFVKGLGEVLDRLRNRIAEDREATHA